ncbi:MAG: hypothetical protein ABW051_02150, partial [Burkholderiaceae bacterium]
LNIKAGGHDPGMLSAELKKLPLNDLKGVYLELHDGASASEVSVILETLRPQVLGQVTISLQAGTSTQVVAQLLEGLAKSPPYGITLTGQFDPGAIQDVLHRLATSGLRKLQARGNGAIALSVLHALRRAGSSSTVRSLILDVDPRLQHYEARPYEILLLTMLGNGHCPLRYLSINQLTSSPQTFARLTSALRNNGAMERCTVLDDGYHANLGDLMKLQEEIDDCLADNIRRRILEVARPPGFQEAAANQVARSAFEAMNYGLPDGVAENIGQFAGGTDAARSLASAHNYVLVNSTVAEKTYGQTRNTSIANLAEQFRQGLALEDAAFSLQGLSPVLSEDELKRLYVAIAAARPDLTAADILKLGGERSLAGAAPSAAPSRRSLRNSPPSAQEIKAFFAGYPQSFHDRMAQNHRLMSQRQGRFDFQSGNIHTLTPPPERGAGMKRPRDRDGNPNG